MVTKAVMLTGQQRLIVMRTWHKLSTDISLLGIETMTQLLEKTRRLAKLFNFKDSTLLELQLNPRFRQHAFWLIQAVSAMVENLDDPDLMVAEMFIEIGQKHAAIPNFAIEYFSILPNAWAYVWEEHLRDRYTVQTSKSWSHIFHYIVDHLEFGCKPSTEVRITPSASASSTSISISMEDSSSTTINEASMDSSIAMLPPIMGLDALSLGSQVDEDRKKAAGETRMDTTSTGSKFTALSGPTPRQTPQQTIKPGGPGLARKVPLPVPETSISSSSSPIDLTASMESSSLFDLLKKLETPKTDLRQPTFPGTGVSPPSVLSRAPGSGEGQKGVR